MYELKNVNNSLNSSELLYQEIFELFNRHIILPKHLIVLLVLWCIATHGKSYTKYAAILLVTSATKGSGKSTVLEIVSEIVSKAHFTSSISSAGIFRVMSEGACLILDEVDTYFDSKSEMTGIINNLYMDNGAGVTRCNADEGYRPESYSQFGFTAIGMIGLPSAATIIDRSIHIPLKKKKATEEVAKFRGKSELTSSIKMRVSRWMRDHETELKGMDYPRLGSGDDRYDDKYEFPLAIAQLISPEVYEGAKRAALMHFDSVANEEDIRLVLLGDIRTAFCIKNSDKMGTGNLVSTLDALNDEQYAYGGKTTPRKIASVLRSFGISPVTIRDGSKTFKGYRREDFEDAFDRYLN